MCVLWLGDMNNEYANGINTKQQPENKNNLLFCFVTRDTKAFRHRILLTLNMNMSVPIGSYSPVFSVFCVANFNGGGKEM